jgi:S1-C subfamily serine protease
MFEIPISAELGLGLALEDVKGKVEVKGFRQMPEGVKNPAKMAGVLPGDIITSINSNTFEDFAGFVELLRAVRDGSGTVLATAKRKQMSR